MRISDWSSDVCSSDLVVEELDLGLVVRHVSLPWSAVADRVEVVVAAGAAAVLVAPPRPDIVRIEAPAAVRSEIRAGAHEAARALDDRHDAGVKAGRRDRLGQGLRPPAIGRAECRKKG